MRKSLDLQDLSFIEIEKLIQVFRWIRNLDMAKDQVALSMADWCTTVGTTILLWK